MRYKSCVSLRHDPLVPLSVRAKVSCHGQIMQNFQPILSRNAWWHTAGLSEAAIPNSMIRNTACISAPAYACVRLSGCAPLLCNRHTTGKILAVIWVLPAPLRRPTSMCRNGASWNVKHPAGRSCVDLSRWTGLVTMQSWVPRI